MARLVWNKVGEHYYETGIEKGVLYPCTSGAYGAGEPWNGLISLTEKPTGAEATPLFADNIKYLNLLSNEDFEFNISCYTYPDGFEAANGIKDLAPGVKVSQQARATFGMSYVTKIGNDTEGQDHGYKIHLVYGATASVAEKAYNTVNNDPEATELSYDCTTTPVEVPGMKPSAHIEIDSTTVGKEKLSKLEDILYGKDGEPSSEARLPLPSELATILAGS